MNKPLAKSLHTVTVLVAIAREYKHTQSVSNSHAVYWALHVLDLAYAPDPYGLAAQAIAKMNKGNV